MRDCRSERLGLLRLLVLLTPLHLQDPRLNLLRGVTHEDHDSLLALIALLLDLDPVEAVVEVVDHGFTRHLTRLGQV